MWSPKRVGDKDCAIGNVCHNDILFSHRKGLAHCFSRIQLCPNGVGCGDWKYAVALGWEGRNMSPGRPYLLQFRGAVRKRCRGASKRCLTPIFLPPSMAPWSLGSRGSRPYVGMGWYASVHVWYPHASQEGPAAAARPTAVCRKQGPAAPVELYLHVVLQTRSAWPKVLQGISTLLKMQI